MKKIGPRISENTEKFILNNFRSVNAGGEYFIEAFLPLFKRTLADLRGVFTDSELKLMVDVFNSTVLTPALAGQHLFINCSDGMELDRLDHKWEVTRKTLLEKLQALSIFQAACLEVWACGFWLAKDAKEKKLNEYIEFLK